MIAAHYPAMVVAYFAALAAWVVASRLLPTLWRAGPTPSVVRPVREFGIALVGGLGVLAVGQLWIRGIRLPEDGALGPLFGAVNQVLIFAPILLVPVIRRHDSTTAWLPRPNLAARLGVGLVLATVVVTVYALLREGADAPWTIVSRIWRYQHLDELVQVLLEDLTIAILFVRLAGAIGSRAATVAVACLFAVGHIPALLSGGAGVGQLLSLVRDAGLGVAVILVLQRSRDIIWFWPIHFCLDLTQYGRISGVQ